MSGLFRCGKSSLSRYTPLGAHKHSKIFLPKTPLLHLLSIISNIMSPQRETDTFPIHVTTSVDYLNRLAKKLPRGSRASKVSKAPPKTKRERSLGEGKLPQQSEIPVLTLFKPQNRTKTRPVQSGKNGVPRSAGRVEPPVYLDWEVIFDEKYLLWGMSQRYLRFITP